MSGWFSAQIVHTGRLPLFCFFVAFVAGFGCVRLSVRLIRAKVKWWPRNIVAGAVHVHHMVFGVVLMGVGGVAELAAPPYSLVWRSAPPGAFVPLVFIIGAIRLGRPGSPWARWRYRDRPAKLARASRREERLRL